MKLSLKGMFSKIAGLPKGVKASAAFFFASVITSGISYIVTPIYTRLLDPAVVGQASNFMTWTHTFAIIAMFCLSYGVFNNGMLDYPDKRDEYSFSMLVLSNIITLAFAAVVLPLHKYIEGFVGVDMPLMLLMCVMFLFQPAYSFWVARQRYELKYKFTVMWTVICAFISPLVAILAILIFKDHPLYARLFGADVALIAVYIGFYVYIIVKSKCKLETKYWKPALMFNLPLIPHYLSSYLLSSSNKILIKNLVGDTQLGYYHIAFAVSNIVNIIWTAINSSLIPYTYAKCKEKDYKSISNVTLPILTAFAVMCLAVMMFAPEVVAVMGGTEYMEVIYVIPPTVGGVFFQVQYFIYANIVYYYKKPKYVMYASVTTVVLNFVLGYVLISNFGYLAAGYSMLICYLLQATFDYLAMRKVVGQNVYNMKYIGVLSLAVILTAVFSNLLYDMIIVRYGIVVAVLAVGFILRKKIIGIIKEMRKK